MANPDEEKLFPLREIPTYFERLQDAMEDLRSQCQAQKEAARAERLRLLAQREVMAKLRITLAKQREQLVEERKRRFAEDFGMGEPA